MSYEGSDDEEEIEMVNVISNNSNNYNVVSNSKSDDEEEKNLFDKNFDTEVEATPKTTVNAKWYML